MVSRGLQGALGLVAALLLASAAKAGPPIPTQLPTGVEPVSYDLLVTPDAKALTFAGHVVVTEIGRAHV